MIDLMKTTKLGNSDLEVPIICIGTMNWGTYNDEDQTHEQLDYAVEERGIKFIDTAEAYPIPPTPEKQGLTESYIGSWIKKRGKRDDLILASKVCNAPFVTSRPTGADMKLDKASLHEAIDGTLQRLQTDYIDLYQIHWPERSTNFFGNRNYQHNSYENPTPIQETLEALQELIDSGKVRNIGISNETPWGVGEYLRLARENGLPRIVSNQTHYNLLNRTFEIGLAEQAIREDVPLLAYSVLSGGALSGKYLGGKKPKGSRFAETSRNSARNNGPQLQTAIQRYVDVAKKHNLDPVQMSIAFAAQQPFMGSVIIGTTSVEQMQICIDAGEMTLSQEVLDDIDAVYREIPDPTC